MNLTYKISRRNVLKVLSVAWGLLIAGKALFPKIGFAGTEAEEPKRTFPALPEVRNQNILRMQKEVEAVLRKRRADRDWIMVIDLQKCVGCHACTVACITENHLPSGVVYRPVLEKEMGAYPNVTRRFLPRPCMQCDNPPCVPVCPVGATYKRSDGIVPINYDRCIGCRACISACPYGARSFDFGENHTDRTPHSPQPYEQAASPEYGENRPRVPGESPIENVRKCHFCLHRLKEGRLPACVTTCLGGATYFGPGPRGNPRSLVSKLIASARVMKLKEELGTDPRVYYLM